jgi:hypothetical protein
MSILDKRREAAGKPSSGQRVSPEFQAHFPVLTQFLTGVPSLKKPGQVDVFSLSIFASEGTCRFSLRCFETGETWFGSAGADVAVLEAIEKSLAEGTAEQKREKRLPAGTL